MRVFEFIGVASTAVPAHVERFAEGLALYRACRFVEARAVFLASPGDEPSRKFAAWCDALIAEPPAEDRDGVFPLGSK